MKKVVMSTVYTLWAVAYNVYKGYESQATDKVILDTSSYGKRGFVTCVITERKTLDTQKSKYTVVYLSQMQ